MNLDDISKELGNRINQPHYIKHWLEKVSKGAHDKGLIAGRKEAIEFGMWLTGHDKDTIRQMFLDYIKPRK